MSAFLNLFDFFLCICSSKSGNVLGLEYSSARTVKNISASVIAGHTIVFGMGISFALHQPKRESLKFSV
jgi:hypothetical protein